MHQTREQIEVNELRAGNTEPQVVYEVRVFRSMSISKVTTNRTFIVTHIARATCTEQQADLSHLDGATSPLSERDARPVSEKTGTASSLRGSVEPHMSTACTRRWLCVPLSLLTYHLHAC